MRDTVLHGICKKEFKMLMKPIKGCPDSIPEKMCGYDVGDHVYVYLSDGMDWYGDRKDQIYIVKVNYKTVELTRQEVEDLVDIKFEYGCYNGCVKDGIPCKNLIGFKEGKTERDTQDFNAWCRISWEVGRGSCSGYDIEEVDLDYV